MPDTFGAASVAAGQPRSIDVAEVAVAARLPGGFGGVLSATVVLEQVYDDWRLFPAAS